MFANKQTVRFSNTLSGGKRRLEASKSCLEGSGVNFLTVSFTQWLKAGLEASKWCLEGSGVIFLTVSFTQLLKSDLEASMV